MVARLTYVTLALFALTFAACVTQKEAPSRVRIVSKRLADGEIPLAKGESVLLGFEAFDADGKPFAPDPDCVTWTSDGTAAIVVQPRIPSAQAFASASWFDTEIAEPTDAGATGMDGGATDASADAEVADMPDAMAPMMPYGREPEAIVTADVCGATDHITIRSVTSIAGTWQISVGPGVVQTAVLKQAGRRIIYVAAEGVEQDVGEVRGNTVSFRLMGYDLLGTLSSPQNAAGNIVGVPSPDGDWSALKQLPPAIPAQ